MKHLAAAIVFATPFVACWALLTRDANPWVIIVVAVAGILTAYDVIRYIEAS